MSTEFSPKVITASALLEGDVVYLSNTTEFTRNITEAQVFTEQGCAEQSLSQTTARTSEVVGAYLADVTLQEGIASPLHFREIFRTVGPSNYHHGKQAVAVAGAA